MKRWQAYLVFVLLAPIAAGAFGALHNQISYTVSPEYFTRFKFAQFGLLASDWPPRLLASVVGWRASWWMGIPLGFLGGLGLLVSRPGAGRARAVWQSLAVMLGATLLVALGGLLYGVFATQQIDLSQYQGWFIPDGVSLPQFLRAGYMHNAAYLGGVLSIVAAWFIQVLQGRFARGDAL